MKLTTSSFLMILAGTLLISCHDPNEDVVQDRNVEIINDEDALNERMDHTQDTIFSTEDDQSGRKVNHFRLILKASLAPPQIDGKLLQATAIQEHWGGYLVSYNFQGEEYLGAVDFVSSSLSVQSEILYRDADIHAVTAHDRYVYLAGARQNEENQAYVERILLNGMKFTLTDNLVVPLGSYAATSVLQHQGKIFVTTGDDQSLGGGVYRLDASLNQLGQVALHDARWVEGFGNEIFVAQGTPGTVSVFSASNLSESGSFSFPGAEIAEAKTTVDVADNMIFVSAGAEGVKVLSKKDGSLLHTITFEEGIVTNAVSAENGLLFIANGEHGAYVASYETGSSSEAPVVLGKIDLAKNQSVNHVLFKNYRLWIASGLGGIQQADIEIW